MINIAICDDEKYFLDKESDIISNYLSQKKDVEYTIDSYSEGKELLEKCKNEMKYNIIFLDINMDDMDGLEVAGLIRKKYDQVYLVFVTGFISYALEGYKVNAIRYILKDNNSIENSITECLDSIFVQLGILKQKIGFDFREGYKEIYIDKIMYVESDKHYLTMHTTDSLGTDYSMYKKLDEIELLLPESSFCRIHKSYLINLKYVCKINRYNVILNDGTVLNIAKSRYPEVRKQYICYEGKL